MNKYNIQIAFFDFDWTLFEHKNHTYIESSIEAINNLHKNGIKVFLNSARPFCACRELGVFDKFKFDGAVCQNGGTAYIGSKLIYSNPFSNEMAQNIIKKLKFHKIPFIICTADEAYIKNYKSELVEQYYTYYYEPYPKSFIEYKGDPIIEIQVFCTDKLDKFFNKLAKKHNFYYYRFFSNSSVLNKTQNSKSDGIDIILKYYGITKTHAIAFGDDKNDISMFKAVRFSVCMGNGKDEAKKEATFVTSSIYDDGVKVGLKQFDILF